MAEYLIVIPAYNPPESFPPYVRALSEAGFSHILVVDDGSREEFQGAFAEAAQVPGCEILRHAVNLGKGRALKNAFNYCLNHREYAGMITVDCDGQHTVADVAKLRAAMDSTEAHAFILGCRDFNAPNVPPKSRFGNKLTCRVFRLLYGTRFSDTQTGLRGFNREAMEAFIAVSGERFEYETNMLIQCCRRKLSFSEIPIETVYFDNNAETHFRPIKDSLLIYGTIFRSFLLYGGASILSFLLDISLFSLFFNLFGAVQTAILPATALARAGSSLFNFLANKNVVFSSSGPWKRAAAKYYTLCVLQLLCSAGLVTLAYRLFHIQAEVLKVVVDTLLFLLSYQIQRIWVFRS